MIFEGQEKADFWTAIGGQEAYASEKRLQLEESEHPTRLFQCSNASGNFVVEEIPNFNQVDSFINNMLFYTCISIYRYISYFIL